MTNTLLEPRKTAKLNIPHGRQASSVRKLRRTVPIETPQGLHMAAAGHPNVAFHSVTSPGTVCLKAYGSDEIFRTFP
jgi:hypothetical protein